jgi:hypothetical protein
MNKPQAISGEHTDACVSSGAVLYAAVFAYCSDAIHILWRTVCRYAACGWVLDTRQEHGRNRWVIQTQVEQTSPGSTQKQTWGISPGGRPNQRILAEYGRIGAAHHLRPSLARTASENSERVDHLVGGRGGGLECNANAVHLGRQTQGASNPRKTTSSRWLSRNHSPPSVNCGMTH